MVIEAGGARGPITQRISYGAPMQGNASVATPEVRRVADRLEMERRMRRFLADFAAHCIQTVPPAQRADDQTMWLQDMKRPDGKRNQRFVDTLCDLVQLAGKADSPLMFAEGIQGETLRQMPAQVECPAEAYRIATKEQAEAIVAGARWSTEPSPTWRKVAIQEIAEAMTALRGWANALHLWPSTDARRAEVQS